MLSDIDLKTLLLNDPSIVSPFPPQFNKPFTDLAWDKYESPIQPASIDLFAGNIYIPGKGPGKKGSHGNGVPAYTIPQGQSVIVTTFQCLKLPDNIGGIVFPPSGDLSSHAILVSNIGHIDPGFTGPLRFTLINMGNEEFSICEGKTKVGTLMLFNTSTAVAAGWHTRALAANKVPLHGSKPEPDQKEIDALAPYFAGMDARMKKIAIDTLTPFKYLNAQIVWPIVFALIIFLISTFLSFGYDYLDQKKRVLELEHQIESIELKDSLSNKSLKPKESNVPKIPGH